MHILLELYYISIIRMLQFDLLLCSLLARTRKGREEKQGAKNKYAYLF